MKAQRQSLDRISALPQDITEKILTLMPIRDALRTSILSRKWRYSWRTMPKLAFNDSLIVESDNNEIDQYKFVKAIFHVLLLHRAPILEFDLSVYTEIFSEIDQILLHLSSNSNIKKFIFEISGDSYSLPCSFFSLQGLEYLDLSNCDFEHLSMNKGFCRLKKLRFYDCYFTNEMLLGFLTNCPLLEEFTWTIQYNDNIELTECELVELFKCLPSVQFLEISKLHIKHLAAGSMPHKLPISLVHLRILVLNVCFLELSAVLCVISSSPNLEKITLECPQQTFNNLHDLQDYTSLNLDHLKELKITRFREGGCWMEFVKLVMARSPMLKKAEIELCTFDSVAKETKMFRQLLRMQFSRSSPTANFIIQWPENYRRNTNKVVMMFG